MRPSLMTDRAYEAGLAVSFEASHVMEGMEGPEGVLHSHDYRVEAVVGRAELDDDGMVCDLDILAAALDRLRGELEGQNLEVIRPPERESVTVEVFAGWAHRFLSAALADTGVEWMRVRVWESDLAFGGYSGPVG